MTKTQAEKIISIIKEAGILRSRDLDMYHIHPQSLHRLVKNGKVVRVGRGLYTLPDVEITSSYHSFAETSKRIPNGVICLLSALTFHELTTQVPFEIWIALDEKAWRPRENGIPIHIVRFSKKAFTEGVEEHLIESVSVKITNPAKTVADCFKYRNKIGLDVALEALKEGLHEGKFTRDEVWHYSKICRVTNVIRPYMEAMT